MFLNLSLLIPNTRQVATSGLCRLATINDQLEFFVTSPAKTRFVLNVLPAI